MSIYDTLACLGITPAPVAVPAAAYVPLSKPAIWCS